MTSFSQDKTQRIPISIVLIAPYVALTLAAVALVGYISFVNGQLAVNDVALQLRQQIGQRVVSQMRTLLNDPRQLLTSHAATFNQGLIQPNNTAEIQQYFLSQLKISPNVSSIYFGNPAGGIIGSGREGFGGIYYTYQTENLTRGTFTKTAIHGDILSTVPNFDARTRPWHINAIRADAFTWNPIYILFTGQEMALSASMPLYDKQNNLLGVLSTDIFLSQFSHYLSELEIAPGGYIFITEQSGLLVATSNGESLTRATPNGKLERISINESATPLIVQTSKFLKETQSDFRHKENGTITFLEFNDPAGEKYFIDAIAMHDEYGLDWDIVIVTPQSAFMGRIESNNRAASIIGAIGISLVLLVGIYITQKINHSVTKLNTSAQSIATGQWNAPLLDNTRIAEVNELITSFNYMQAQLRQSLENLTHEVEERKRTEKALGASEAKFRNLIQQSYEGFNLIRLDGIVVEWNQGMEQITGIPQTEAIGQPIWEIQHRLTPPEKKRPGFQEKLETTIRISLQSVTANPINQSSENEILRPDGTRRFISVNMYSFSLGETVLIGGTMHDITERHKALNEKETLLRELYHRTKNNMQVISSLLALQQGQSNNPQVDQLINEMRNRIISMALVHEKLYQAQNLSSINLGEYLGELTDLVRQSYNLEAEVEIHTDLQPIPAVIDIAIPCGLILNELLSNIFKYAFPENRPGIITISLRAEENGYICLTVNDNGIGYPANFNPAENGRLGMETIYALGENQLQGSVSFRSTPGVTCAIRFKNNLYQPRV